MANCPNNILHRGDQYILPVHVFFDDGTAVTPEDVKALKIQIGNVVASYPDGNLAFYGEYWGLPLTSAQTALMKGTVRAQVGYLIDATWQHTDIEEFSVGDTLSSLLEVPDVRS